jgi:hypothetical protein
MKTKRTQYVATLWARARTRCPAEGLSPIDYGWFVSTTDNILKPVWFRGPAIPNTSFRHSSEDITDVVVEGNDDEEEMIQETLSDSDSDCEAWSETDSEMEEIEEYL